MTLREDSGFSTALYFFLGIVALVIGGCEATVLKLSDYDVKNNIVCNRYGKNQDKLDDYLKYLRDNNIKKYNSCETYEEWHYRFENGQIVHMDTFYTPNRNVFLSAAIGIILFCFTFWFWLYKGERIFDSYLYNTITSQNKTIADLEKQIEIAANVIKSQELELDTLRIYKRNENS